MKRKSTRALAAAAALAALPSLAADIVLTPPAGYSVNITDAAGTTPRLRVNDNGTIQIQGQVYLPHSTATMGSIMKGIAPFLHDYGAVNIFVGLGAGNLTMTGTNNAGVGQTALTTLTTGSFNTGVGASALNANASGASNTAIGYNAFADIVVHTANVGVGANAGRITTSNNNTAIGYQALYNNTTGGGNTAVGANAGSNWTTGTNNIALGNTGVAGETATMRLGSNALQTRAFIAGVRTAVTGVADAVGVLIDSSGQLGVVSSARETKQDIADMDAASSDLMKLHPVTFHYKAYGAQSRLQYGLVAEEVEQVYPGLVTKHPDGSAETVMYHFLPPMLLNEYQKQQRAIESQQRTIARQGDEIAELKQMVGQLIAQGRKQ